MTQSQTHQQYLAGLRFYSLSSICTWAGKPTEGSIYFLNQGDVSVAYVEKHGTWYYFGLYPEREYRLVCTSNKDIGAEQ